MDSVGCEISVEIKNADGLHMRPAMMFVDLASQYECEVKVSNDETTVDGKSIMQMSILAATYGTKLKIRAEGKGSEEAIEQLRQLIEDRMFDEPGPENQ